MKKILLLIQSAVLLSACVRPASTPTPTQAPTDPLATYIQAPTLFIVEPSDTPVPTTTDVEAEETAIPTDAPPEQETSTPTTVFVVPTGTATEGSAPEETQEELPTPEPYATLPAFQPPETPPLNPVAAFGNPRFIENFEDSTTWKDYYGNMENERLALFIEGGQMRVTGKIQDFITWWFGGFELEDFYIEMTVDSGDCSGEDAYGLILRGEPSSHGYIVAFTCDGQIFSRRIDSPNPYRDQQILGYTDTNLLRPGSNQTNIMGVLMEDSEISIYANGYYFTIILDDNYDYGQYGVFVMAGPTENYTYTIKEIRVWDVGE